MMKDPNFQTRENTISNLHEAGYSILSTAAGIRANPIKPIRISYT